MRRRINLSGRQLFWIAAASIGLMALGGGVAYATIPDAAGLIHGCYKQGDATKIGGAPLYVTDSDSGATCKAGDAQLTFAQKGGDAYQAAVDFAALSGQNVTVASVALPAGNFFINAKLYVEDTENGALFLCTLNSSNLSSAIDFNQGATDAAQDSQPLSLEGLVALATPGTVSLECSATGHASAALESRIVALKVGTVH